MKKNANRPHSKKNIPEMTTYFYGKIAEVVYILATYPGDIKRRLMLAGEKDRLKEASQNLSARAYPKKYANKWQRRGR
jgi:hypothetical protein